MMNLSSLTRVLTTLLIAAALPIHAEGEAESKAWNVEALGKAFEYAEQEKSSALLVVQDGRVVAERYWKPAAAARSPYTVMQAKPTAEGAREIP